MDIGNSGQWWGDFVAISVLPGRMDIALIFLEQGADVAAQNEYGSTPLRYASPCGHADIARMLVGHGADVVAQDKAGNTQLHCASK